nr:MAG TPA: hypothetical protein [Caudoviricetes sp.]
MRNENPVPNSIFGCFNGVRVSVRKVRLFSLCSAT